MMLQNIVNANKKLCSLQYNKRQGSIHVLASMPNSPCILPQPQGLPREVLGCGHPSLPVSALLIREGKTPKEANFLNEGSSKKPTFFSWPTPFFSEYPVA